MWGKAPLFMFEYSRFLTRQHQVEAAQEALTISQGWTSLNTVAIVFIGAATMTAVRGIEDSEIKTLGC